MAYNPLPWLTTLSSLDPPPMKQKFPSRSSSFSLIGVVYNSGIIGGFEKFYKKITQTLKSEIIGGFEKFYKNLHKH
jgi:hypothetical protein